MYTGATATMDPHVISLEFTAKKNNTRGEFNIWGMIDVPLQLKAQYDSRSALNDHPGCPKFATSDEYACSLQLHSDKKSTRVEMPNKEKAA